MAAPWIAKSLDALRKQVNAAAPGRDKSSDGWIGDARHRATKSEHNPDKNGAVRALDISHDPSHGVIGREIAQALLDSRDPRILYVISNGEMARTYVKTGTTPWQWSKYTGKNGHFHHVHISVVDQIPLYNSEKPWALPARLMVTSSTPIAPVPSPVITAPVVPVPAPRKVLFSARGKMSTFGGPRDTGMKPDEGLALFQTAGEMTLHRLGNFLLPQTKFSGLGRRLNPEKPYLACRWPTNRYPLLKDAVAWVTNPKTGKSLPFRPVDWGPSARTGRTADLSPGGARDLGLNTDDECVVTVYEDGR